MTGKNGLGTIRELQKQKKIPIVFTTVSSDYALETFDVSAAHYLLKPLQKADVFEAMDRCLALIGRINAAALRW